jgi:hypothetical protein
MRNTTKSNRSQRWEYVTMMIAPCLVTWQSAVKCCVALDASMIIMSVIAQESAKRPIGHRTKNFVVRLRKKFQQCVPMSEKNSLNIVALIIYCFPNPLRRSAFIYLSFASLNHSLIHTHSLSHTLYLYLKSDK